MSTVLSMIGSVCLTLIAVGVFEIICPGEKFEQPIKLLSGAVIASALLGIFTSVQIDFSDLVSDICDSDYDYSEQTAKSAARIISGILEQNGVENAQIIIDTSTNENGGIQLSKVRLSANAQTDKRKIAEEISAVLGAEVEFEEEQNE